MFEDVRSAVSELNSSMKELFDYSACKEDDPIFMIYMRLDKRVMRLLYECTRLSCG